MSKMQPTSRTPLLISSSLSPFPPPSSSLLATAPPPSLTIMNSSGGGGGGTGFLIPNEIPEQPDAAGAASPTNFTINHRVALTIVVLLLLISSLIVLSYCYIRYSSRRRLNSAPSPPHPSSGGGIDEATLSNYPKLLYSKAKLQTMSKVDKERCSICLADYRDAETLRMLPDCGHLFHVKCIDAWLRQHPTCPVCRTSPLPTPLSTPLPSTTAAAHDTLPLASRV